ncbi:uncharacterized protein LOC134237591 [Saccostrea cucullata]|uniref:uncharacterized protein LOC134237591 n=1 Tax=Saccostrea cuccullata TaxID=36930 RepID=UPI002ED25BAE
MGVLILILLLCPICQGNWSYSSGLSTYIGENSVTFYCHYYTYVNRNKMIPEMFMEIRQSNSRNWRTLAKANTTGSYILDKDEKLGKYTIRPRSCEGGEFRCRITITASFTLSKCTIDPGLYSVFRCKVSNGSDVFTSEENNFVSTKVKPTHIQTPVITRRSNAIRASDEDFPRPWFVVHLKCTGEIESINGIPSQNIRWCMKIEDKFKEISLQHYPNTTLVWNSSDSCRHIQRSEIIYHIMQSDSFLEIMCESGYSIYARECGRGSISSTILINTSITTEGDANSSMVHDPTFEVTREIPSQALKAEDNTASIVVLSFLLCIVLVVVVAFIITTFRRGKSTIFGLEFRIERKKSEIDVLDNVQKTSSSFLQTCSESGNKSKDQADEPYEETEYNSEIQRQGVYENEVLKNEIFKDGKTSTKRAESDTCHYDGLHIKEERQEYEKLKLQKL